MPRREPPFESSRETLRREHAMLDVLCNDLINRAESDDWRECDAVWDELGRALEAHMSLEEATLFVAFGAEGPEESLLVDRLRREHRDIRQGVERLGVAVQLHTLRADDVRELVETLRRHAALEDSTLYAWADRAVGPFAAPRAGASGPATPRGRPGLA
jgi:hemerythrin